MDHRDYDSPSEDCWSETGRSQFLADPSRTIPYEERDNVPNGHVYSSDYNDPDEHLLHNHVLSREKSSSGQLEEPVSPYKSYSPAATTENTLQPNNTAAPRSSFTSSIPAAGLTGIAGIAAAAASQQGKPLNLAALTLAAQSAAAKKRPGARSQATNTRPERTLFCLSLRNPLRKLCIGFVEWKYPFRYLHVCYFDMTSKLFLFQ